MAFFYNKKAHSLGLLMSGFFKLEGCKGFNLVIYRVNQSRMYPPRR